MMAFSLSPCSRSICIQYSKLDTVKTMGTRVKITRKLHKLADICRNELPRNLLNFTHKDLTEVKIFLKVLGGGYFFSETPCRHHYCQHHNSVKCYLKLRFRLTNPVQYHFYRASTQQYDARYWYSNSVRPSVTPISNRLKYCVETA